VDAGGDPAQSGDYAFLEERQRKVRTKNTEDMPRPQLTNCPAPEKKLPAVRLLPMTARNTGRVQLSEASP
jgi:hypothetical protein